MFFFFHFTDFILIPLLGIDTFMALALSKIFPAFFSSLLDGQMDEQELNEPQNRVALIKGTLCKFYINLLKPDWSHRTGTQCNRLGFVRWNITPHGYIWSRPPRVAVKVLSPGLGYSHVRSFKCVKSTSVRHSHEQDPLPSVRSVLLFLLVHGGTSGM